MALGATAVIPASFTTQFTKARPASTIERATEGTPTTFIPTGTYIKSEGVVRDAAGKPTTITLEPGECIGVSKVTPDKELQDYLNASSNRGIDWQVDRHGTRDGLFPKNFLTPQRDDAGKISYTGTDMYCPTENTALSTTANGEPSLDIIVMAEEKGKGLPGVRVSDRQQILVEQGSKDTPGSPSAMKTEDPTPYTGTPKRSRGGTPRTSPEPGMAHSAPPAAEHPRSPRHTRTPHEGQLEIGLLNGMSVNQDYTSTFKGNPSKAGDFDLSGKSTTL
ncbi:MAG: hypothetical protein HC945_02960, partial [Nitrosarchaeum sp.]|nr:hypothetical protein [Nitrosarchaeum sp.]